MSALEWIRVPEAESIRTQFAGSQATVNKATRTMTTLSIYYLGHNKQNKKKVGKAIIPVFTLVSRHEGFATCRIPRSPRFPSCWRNLFSMSTGEK